MPAQCHGVGHDAAAHALVDQILKARLPLNAIAAGQQRRHRHQLPDGVPRQLHAGVGVRHAGAFDRVAAVREETERDGAQAQARAVGLGRVDRQRVAHRQRDHAGVVRAVQRFADVVGCGENALCVSGDRGRAAAQKIDQRDGADFVHRVLVGAQAHAGENGGEHFVRRGVDVDRILHLRFDVRAPNDRLIGAGERLLELHAGAAVVRHLRRAHAAETGGDVVGQNAHQRPGTEALSVLQQHAGDIAGRAGIAEPFAVAPRRVAHAILDGQMPFDAREILGRQRGLSGQSVGGFDFVDGSKRREGRTAGHGRVGDQTRAAIVDQRAGSVRKRHGLIELNAAAGRAGIMQRQGFAVHAHQAAVGIEAVAIVDRKRRLALLNAVGQQARTQQISQQRGRRAVDVDLALLVLHLRRPEQPARILDVGVDVVFGDEGIRQIETHVDAEVFGRGDFDRQIDGEVVDGVLAEVRAILAQAVGDGVLHAGLSALARDLLADVVARGFGVLEHRKDERCRDGNQRRQHGDHHQDGDAARLPQENCSAHFCTAFGFTSAGSSASSESPFFFNSMRLVVPNMSTARPRTRPSLSIVMRIGAE